MYLARYHFCIAIAATVLSSPLVHAGLINPIDLTGWSSDVIAENTAASAAAGTNNSVVTFVWYESGAPQSTQGLPTSGSFVSAFNSNVSFQYQPYIANNAVLDNGTVTLTNPGSFLDLAFLTSAQGGGGESFSVTLHFSDTSTDVLTGSDPDWTVNGNNAISNIGLTHPTSAWNASDFYTNTLNMFEHDYTLSLTDQAKTLVSIDFALSGGNHEDLFAVSGETSAAPEPGTLVLVGGILSVLGAFSRPLRAIARAASA